MLYLLSEATAANRRVYLHLVDATDGITPETGEAGGQPQLSKNGAGFVNTDATLTAVSNGLYYVELTAAELNTLGWFAVRYKSAATAEFQVAGQVVAFSPYLTMAESVQSGDYAEGAVWINIAGGAAGTTPYVNGTKHNPVNSLASARTIADNLKLKRFRILNSSTITIDQNYTNFSFYGYPYWTLNLAGFAMAGCNFENAIVSGISTGTLQRFEDCAFITHTTPNLATYSKCTFTATITVIAGSMYFYDCMSSNAADAAPPIFDYGAAVGDTDLLFARWSGGLQVNNMGQTGTDTLNLNGMGRLIIDSTCVPGANLRVRGLFAVANSGTPTSLIEEANYNAANINAEVVDGLNVDTYTEPGQGTPAATLSLAAKINYLFKGWRNRSTQTNTQFNLFNDDATTVDQKASFADDGTTADRGEITTGP
jgi:hypothetical protein